MNTINETKTALHAISLSTIDDIKEFCQISGEIPCKAILYGDRYRVNAASIMGVISLDLSEEVYLELSNEDYLSKFSKWLTKDIEINPGLFQEQ